MAPLNRPGLGIGGAIVFLDFARIYENGVLPSLAATSRWRSMSVLKNHLLPNFGALMLRELTPERLQSYFACLQKTDLSPESIDKIRDVLSAVLRTAVEYDRLSTNPAEKILLKKRQRPRAKPFIRVE